MPSEQFLSLERQAGQLVIRVFGDWVIENGAALKERLSQVTEEAKGFPFVLIRCGSLEQLDTSGAWLLQDGVRNLEQAGFEVEVTGFKAVHSRLFDKVVADLPDLVESPRPGRETLLDGIEKVGAWTVYGLRHTGKATVFLLRLLATLVLCLVIPTRLRFGAVVANMHRAGVNAIPVVALLAFLISIVLAYQGATQLTRFGAEIFTVNLTVVSLLREMGVLLTAILVAGRSGSAFAAEIGSMKLHEETDAMETMGMDPFEVLVLPRVMALVIMVPLLTVLA
ncbi:MAG: ABC transporter permease, partial [Thiohalorhabdus sp.]